MAARKKRTTRKRKTIIDVLKKSPINYMSDLFIVAMVASWIIVLIIMVMVAIWATVHLCDTTMWSYVQELTAIPLTAGGAIWMVKNSVQHAIAYNRGEQAHMDFPAVNADGQNDGIETEMKFKESEEVQG